MNNYVNIINKIQPSLLAYSSKSKSISIKSVFPGVNSLKSIDDYGKLVYRNHEEEAVLEFRTLITPNRFGKLFEKIDSIPCLTIICSDYISPKAKKKLEELGRSYIDSSGSVFITSERILIKTNLTNKHLSPKKINNDLTEKQSRLIQWLIENDFKEMSMRSIQKKVDVSLGTVSNTFKQLVEKEFLVKTSNYYSISNKDKLENYLVGKDQEE